MADEHQFNQEFLKRVESVEVDDDLLKELLALTAEQRSVLAELLVRRKFRHSAKNGDAPV